MLSLSIPVLSPTSGDTSEGVAIGRIAESQLLASLSSANFSTGRKVYRLDRTGGSLAIVDDTTIATSGTTNAWNPFGANFISASAALKVYDSTDGVWATNLLTATSPTQANITDCLRNTGWCRIDFGENNARQSWRPSADPLANMPSRRYIRFELDDGGDKDSFVISCGVSDIVSMFINVTTAGGPATAVRVAEVQIVRRSADIKWNDLLATANGDLSVAPAVPVATYIPLVDAELRYAFSNPAYGDESYIYRRQDNAPTTVAEYLATDSTWKPLQNFTSSSPAFSVGPTVTTTPAQKHPNRWSIPSDWASVAQTFPIEDGSSQTITGYWVRHRTTAISGTQQPINFPQVRKRVRMFGNANVVGAQAATARSYKAASVVGMGSPNATPIVCQTVNGNTGAGQSWTIPANPTLPVAVVFAAPLAVAAGDELLPVVVNSGGQATDVRIVLED